MKRLTLPKSLVPAGWLALGVCVSVAALTGFGYRAIQGWQRSSDLLFEQRAGAAADLLASALTRDMRAAQESVLSSADWDPFIQDPSFDISGIVASAFAKYPYPECFIAARGALDPHSLTFFTRSDRPPAWARSDPAVYQFPVVESMNAEVAKLIIDRVQKDVAAGRRFSFFQIQVSGTPYQVIVQLRYRTPLRAHLEGMLGFMVNLEWVRQNYFQALTTQVASLGGATTGLALAVLDDQGHKVASTKEGTVKGITSRRQFSPMFFDPLLVAVDPPPDLLQRKWTVEATGVADATFAAAIHAADRTLVLTACGGMFLAIGLVMTARAVNANAQLTELRSEFVATVTHELKTPIAAIRAIGNTLASGRITSQSGQREYAELAVREAKRLTRLVDNLLALSRVTDVTEVYSFEPLSIESLVDKALEDFREPLRAGGFETRIDIPHDIPLIWGDQTAIGLMLDNLIDNAIRYSPEARALLIVGRQEGEAVVLNVTDKGRGIPAEDIDQVTRKFFRGRHLVSNGSGLGLAIVKRIVTDHRGRLKITSTVGRGTTMSVSFPVAGSN